MAVKHNKGQIARSPIPIDQFELGLFTTSDSEPYMFIYVHFISVGWPVISELG